MPRRTLLPFWGEFTHNSCLENCSRFAKFLAQSGLIFPYDGLESTNGFVERISIARKDHTEEILDLKCILILDSLSFLLEPLIINLDRLASSGEFEVDFEFAYAVERGT